jgi:cytoskeleton protein RodZ
MRLSSAVLLMSETTMSADRPDTPVTPDPTGIPGKTLAAQREAMGWTVEQVADQLKLAVRQVVALEAGDYASLPSPAVTRGFVRAYAKIVKLDPVPLVAQIDLGSTSMNTGSAPHRERPASFSEVRFPSHGKRSSLPLGMIAGAVVAVAVIGGVAWKFNAIPGMHHAPAALATVPAAVPVTSGAMAPLVTVPAPAGSATDVQSTSVPLISVPPPASTNNTVVGGVPAPAPVVAPATPAAPAAAAATPAAAPAAAPAAGGNALVVAVKEDSWLEIRRVGGGKPIIARLVKAGNTETFDITEPVTVVVGKPDAVTATLRGANIALPLMPGKKFSRVALK